VAAFLEHEPARLLLGAEAPPAAPRSPRRWLRALRDLDRRAVVRAWLSYFSGSGGSRSVRDQAIVIAHAWLRDPRATVGLARLFKRAIRERRPRRPARTNRDARDSHRLWTDALNVVSAITGPNVYAPCSFARQETVVRHLLAWVLGWFEPDGHEVRPSRAFDPHAPSFAGEAVAHPQLGDGVVVFVGAKQIEVFFATGTRKFARNG
jgi:hypothetical protein